MKNSVVDTLLCPRCGLGFAALEPGDSALHCPNGHSFDIAKQGYVNLLTGAGTKFRQDTQEMVAARDTFLESGHYEPLALALSELTQQALTPDPQTGLILDAGTGTGWYLEQILGSFQGSTPRAVALDISKFALRRAGRRNPEAANLVWDLWQPLPLKSGVAEVILVVFAPRNGAEFRRVLKARGTLIVVTPRKGHLAEIAQTAGLLGIQENKQAALDASLEPYFEKIRDRNVSISLELKHHDVVNVALMGPAGHHLDREKLRLDVTQLPEVNLVSAKFRISVFQAAD